MIIICAYFILHTLSSPVRDENGFETGEVTTYNVDRCAQIGFDTNGTNPPNQYGVDIIKYNITSEGKLECYHPELLNNALLKHFPDLGKEIVYKSHFFIL